MRSLAACLAFATVVVAACGDNGDDQPTDARIDGRVDAPDIDAAIDAPDIDAAVDAAIDATEIDAPMIDAAMIDAAMIDAAEIDAPAIDATEIDAPLPIDAQPAVGAHLLVTEVKTVDNSEFVEIYNPTDQTISLRNYYLTDHQSYHLLPGVVAGNTTQPTTDASDVLARFPVGATIAPRQVITVAFDAVGYETAFTSVPTYTIQELGNSMAMEVLWIGATTPNPGLTNAGEMVALFFWDGAADNVKDVDLFVAGAAPTAANNFVAKTAVDGPDVDTMTTAYAIDSAVPPIDMATDTPNATSYKRILLESGQETQAGTGNGITGDDETSENLRTTWDSQAVMTNYTAPTPGAVPAALNP